MWDVLNNGIKFMSVLLIMVRLFGYVVVFVLKFWYVVEVEEEDVD